MKEIISYILERIRRTIGRTRLFLVYVSDIETSYYEDPKCPSYWKGSGCYDIEIQRVIYYRFDVVAKTSSQALEKVNEYILNPKAVSEAERITNYDLQEPEVLGFKISDENMKGEPLGFYETEREYVDDDVRWTRDSRSIHPDLTSAIKAFA